MQPSMIGRRAVYFYAGHHATGARSNHPRRMRAAAAVVAVTVEDLLACAPEARLRYRAWDHAVAVLDDYCGPIVGFRRGIDIMAVKTAPRPPRLIPIACAPAEPRPSQRDERP